MQSDPIGYGGGLNMYAYVKNDPLNLRDSSGLDPDPNCTPNADGHGCVEPGGIVVLGCPDGGTAVNGHCLPSEARNDDWYTYDYLFRSLWQQAENLQGQVGGALKKAICSSPTASGGGGVDAYLGAGGSISGAGSFNPRNGQISLSFDLGVGLGLGADARYAVGKFAGLGSPSSGETRVVTAGLNLNATGVTPLGGVAGSYQLVGANQGDWGLAGTQGAGASGNVNVSAHIQVNLPTLYDLGC